MKIERQVITEVSYYGHFTYRSNSFQSTSPEFKIITKIIEFGVIFIGLLKLPVEKV